MSQQNLLLCHLKWKWACKIVCSHNKANFSIVSCLKASFSLEMTRMIIDSNSSKENHLLDDASCQYWAIIFTIMASRTLLCIWLNGLIVFWFDSYPFVWASSHFIFIKLSRSFLRPWMLSFVLFIRNIGAHMGCDSHQDEKGCLLFISEEREKISEKLQHTTLIYPKKIDIHAKLIWFSRLDNNLNSKFILNGWEARDDAPFILHYETL